MAICLVVSFFAYLRPCEARALLVRHLVPPPAAGDPNPCWALLLHDADLGVAGKTGLWDETVILDTTAALNPFFTMIRNHRNGDEYLFNFRWDTYTRQFNDFAVHLGLQPLQPTMYGLRHGGASDDLRAGRRTALGVQLRGRWRTAASLRRYAKAARLQTQLAKVPAEVQQYGTLVEKSFVEWILGATTSSITALPAPPLRARLASMKKARPPMANMKR